MKYDKTFAKLYVFQDGEKEIMHEDVCLCSNERFMPLFQWFEKQCKYGLPIKNNALYFSYHGVKYWIKPSCLSEEYTIIAGLINRLRIAGCDKFYYQRGTYEY